MLTDAKRQEIAALEAECDFAFAREDFSAALDAVDLASRRVAEVHESFRALVHGGSEQEDGKQDVDVALRQTVEMVRRTLLPSVNVVADYASIPEVRASGIGQVFLNLIQNAVDAVTNEDAGVIRVWSRRATNGWIEVGVQDNGPGVPPDLRDKVFEPMFSTHVDGKGTGLGLPLALDLVEKSGGSLELQDVPEGACFVVRLPAPP